MKTHDYADNSPIDKVEFKQSISGAEAVIYPSTEVKSPKTVTLPDELRKQGMSAELAVVGRSPALKVRGFGSEEQVLDTIAKSGLGSPVASREEGPQAARISAARQDGGQRTR